MPIIEVSFKEFCKLVGRNLPKNKEKLWDITQYVKCEVDSIEGDTLRLELQDTNRPDLWNETGVAREIQGAINLKSGLKKYELTKSDKTVNVDSSVKKIRPFIASAIAKNVRFNDYQIKQLIQLQDKLDNTHGRNRRKSAIGIYDYDRIVFPVTYKAVSPDSIKFTPLGFTHELTPEEILKEHPKGVEYANILKGQKKYPILLDAAKNVLSMPPIINSNHLGKVTPETKNVFIEVTGTDYRAVLTALNIVSCYLSDKGAEIESVTVKNGRRTVVTPNYTNKDWKIDIKDINQRLGLVLDLKEIKELLGRGRYGIKKISNDSLIVEAPFYRTDIMHPFDIVEDIGIMYGYKNIESEPLKTYTIGELSKDTIFENKIRDLCVGLGFQEVLNYTRCDSEFLFNKNVIEIANPIGEILNYIRNELLPIELLFLSKNTQNEYPQRVFETGPVLVRSKKEVVEEDHLCLVDASNTADFTAIKQITDWLLRTMKINYELVEYSHEAFIPGRCAAILVNGKTAGYFGELHPKTLIRFGLLETPGTALELNLEKLKK